MKYVEQVKNMTKDNNLTDFEMQLLLHKKGIILYDEQKDNDVDNEVLFVKAVNLGYKWDESKELWVKK